ncbi:helix-turn-helix domain-containing protein [Streptomyces sp. NPDC101178]|uniref:helix-turn-helix domain-containing protein n=1 Tax=Streptomyces sp. NPDC101178 TaxID=3366124 RepID=UPI00382DBA08
MPILKEHYSFDRTDIHQLRDFLVNQRRLSGWTQEELSDRSGVSVRTIRNLETGSNTNPRRTSVSLLLTALGATATAFPEPAPWDSGRRPALGQSPDLHSDPTALPPWQGPRPLGDALVGRQADLGHVLSAAQRSRLIVLTGPGGVGKTRIALAAASRLRPLFQGGVAVAELHDVPPQHLEPAASAAELTRVVRRLTSGNEGGVRGSAGLGRRLLVLDSAEHVSQQTARIARQLLDEHPGLQIIVTSRRALAVGAAETWEVEPLSCDRRDDSDTELPSAVELFVRRVRASLPTLDLGNRLPLVQQLCRLLDGMPLAIEVAARGLRSLPLTTLLHDGTLFHLLAHVDAGDLSRHRTLSDSVRWSYELLPAPHRELLRELSSLPGTFSLDAIPARAGGGFGSTRVAHLLAELADVSLVQINRGQQYRYGVHALVRHWVTQEEASTDLGRSAEQAREQPVLAGSAWRRAI